MFIHPSVRQRFAALLFMINSAIKIHIMRSFFCTLLITVNFSCFAQQIILDKSKDTIQIDDKDSLATIGFKIERTSMNDYPRLQIRVHSGTAKEGKDFELRDAYNATVKEINITRVQNKSGYFQIYFSANPKEVKTINLETIIWDNKVRYPGIVSIVLVPASTAKKTETSEKNKDEKKDEKKDSISLLLYNDIGVHLYDADDSALKKKVGHFFKKEVPITINIDRVEVKKITPTKYNIRIVSTQNDIYYATIDLTTDFHFKEDDRIYLDGKNANSYVRAQEILEISVQESDANTKVLTPENSKVKFKN
jgi:hypothetical protein